MSQSCPLPLTQVDAAPVRWTVTDRGLVGRVRPTWSNAVRAYTGVDGKPVRVLRRAEQVNHPRHLDTLRRLTGTRRHPSREGRRVFLSASAAPGSPAPWDETVELQPHKDYFAATVGDTIEMVDVPGMGLVPELSANIVDGPTLEDIRNGLVEVSLGYVSWFVPAEEIPVGGDIVAIGQWKNPITGIVESFDLEGICDPGDPRVPPDYREHIGGNHLAFAVPQGRGGPHVRLMLDAADELGAPCRVFALRRSVDESGVFVAVVLASAEDAGPAVALWTTAASSGVAYDSLETFRRIHIEAHGDGANELTPLMLSAPVPVRAPTPADPPLAAETDKDKKTMADPTPPTNDAPPTNPAPPAPTSPPADPTAALKAKQAEFDALLIKYNALVAELEAIKQKLAATDDAKGKAEAKADALAEELVPHREAALRTLRADGIRITNATGELAERIGKATADELPSIVVSAYYSTRAEARSVIDEYDRKVADPSWLRPRFEMLREQTERPRTATRTDASDGFSSSFRPTDKTSQPVTGQARLDAMQKGN